MEVVVTEPLQFVLRGRGEMEESIPSLPENGGKGQVESLDNIAIRLESAVRSTSYVIIVLPDTPT
jgi:hypothetical protein